MTDLYGRSTGPEGASARATSGTMSNATMSSLIFTDDSNRNRDTGVPPVRASLYDQKHIDSECSKHGRDARVTVTPSLRRNRALRVVDRVAFRQRLEAQALAGAVDHLVP